MKFALILATLAITGCTTTTSPEQRSAQVPNVPVEKRDCNSPLGHIPDGETATGYMNPVESGGRTCQSGKLTCHDGQWSGPYIHQTCTTIPSTP